MTEGESHALDGHTAELLARQINTAFTMASGYGINHPMFHKACEGLQESLTDALKGVSSISLLMDRGALFIDKFPVGQRFNPRRLMNLLSQLGIESISFSSGIGVEDIQKLMVCSTDHDQYPDVTAIQSGLQAEDVTTIRLNYIQFRQVTADQKVVAEGQASADGAAASADASSRTATDSFDPITSLLSLNELVRDPEQYAEKLEQESAGDSNRRQVVRQLRNLVSQIERGEVATGSAVSSEAVMSAVNDLRFRIRKSIDTRRDVELILSEEDQVVGEVDQLTYSTLVSLVREEFRGGKFSAKRMAQIINRMLPDARDLKRLLPQLKKGLLAEGMSLDEWATLVSEMSTELRGEHLIQALEEGAENVGLDVDEIIDQIREDPSEAARLIVMATELRRSGAGEEEQLSAAFSEYIERISDKLSLKLGEGMPNSEALDSQLFRVRQLLVEQLNRQGLPPDLIESVRGRLQPKPPATAEQPEPEKRAAAAPEEKSDIDGPGETEPPPSEDLATGSNLAEEYDDTSDEPVESSPISASLPQRVLNPENTAFFLDREIKSARRYKTAFSVIKVSIELVRDRPGPPRAPKPDDFDKLLPQLYAEIIAQLRDLDLVGSLDKQRQAVPLMILPMTPTDGAEIVLKRLLKRLKLTPFRLSGMPTQLLCAVSCATFQFDSEETDQAFRDRVEEEHEISREMLHLEHDTTELKSKTGLRS